MAELLDQDILRTEGSVQEVVAAYAEDHGQAALLGRAGTVRAAGS